MANFSQDKLYHHIESVSLSILVSTENFVSLQLAFSSEMECIL